MTVKDYDVSSGSGLTYQQLHLRVDGVGLRVATAGRGGELAPVVFLHGFGSTKEDYVDIALQPAFAGRPFLAYDAPGCGETSCEEVSKISIPFLVKTARTVLQRAGIERFHLVGHSMGGLTALQLAHQDPGRVLSLVNIEGNIVPEDCFLSRQVLTHPSDDADSFFEDFIERTRRSPFYSSALSSQPVHLRRPPPGVLPHHRVGQAAANAAESLSKGACSPWFGRSTASTWWRKPGTCGTPGQVPGRWRPCPGRRGRPTGPCWATRPPDRRLPGPPACVRRGRARSETGAGGGQGEPAPPGVATLVGVPAGAVPARGRPARRRPRRGAAPPRMPGLSRGGGGATDAARTCLGPPEFTAFLAFPGGPQDDLHDERHHRSVTGRRRIASRGVRRVGPRAPTRYRPAG